MNSNILNTYESNILEIYISNSSRQCWFTLLCIFFYCLYLTAGGCIFFVTERSTEKNLRTELQKVRQNFLDENSCLTEKALEEFIIIITEAQSKGLSSARNVTDVSWNFGQSLFFSGTVITTVGYGHISPLSKEGKIICIIYALIGIPLTIVLITALAEKLMLPSIKFLQFLDSHCKLLRSSFHIRLLHFIIIFLTTVVIFFLIPAAIFTALEPNWDYLDSFYYTFISLTTIGLGDLVPGDFPNQQYKTLYKILLTVYLVLGLTAMMLLLNIFSHIPQLNFGRILLYINNNKNSETTEILKDTESHNYTHQDNKKVQS